MHALLHACSCASAATCVRDLSSPLVAVGGFWPSVFLCYKSSRPPSVKSLQQSQSSCTLSFSRSVSCAHTRWKSRPPKRLHPLGSPARVRTAITFLGSVSGGTTTRFVPCSRRRRQLLPVRATARHDFFLALGERAGSSQQLFCTAPSGTTTSTKHHVAFGCFRLCRWVCRFNSENQSFCV